MVVAFAVLPPLPLPLFSPHEDHVSDQHYPGSKQLRRAVAPVAKPVPRESGHWDAVPIVKTIRGQSVEVFTVGQLGQSVGRAAVTIRLWERKGFLPKARMRLADRNGKGGRRYYTRAQVEGIARIAKEEGLLEPQAPLTPEFTRRVFQLFVDLEKK